MSYITEVTIQTNDAKAIDKINAWLRENDRRQPQLNRIPTLGGGGTGGIHTDVWNASFNHMNWGLLDLLEDPDTWDWRCASWAVVFEEGILVGLCRYGAVSTVHHQTEYRGDVVRYRQGGKVLAEHLTS